MSHKDLLAKHHRLREELSAAYEQPCWDSARIDRIAGELAAVERHLTVRCRREQAAEDRVA